MGIHDSFIHQNFNDSTIGSDLPNCEIKTNSQRNRPKIYLKLSDFEIPNWIIWDYTEQLGYVVNSKDFKKMDSTKHAKSIYIKEIKQKAKFFTNSIKILKFYYEKFLS